MTKPLRITHLLDDPALGGVTRTIDTIRANLGPAYEHAIEIVDARRPAAPRLDGDILVAHFTANWAKLPFLAALRMHNRAPLILVEHSYTAAYEKRFVHSRLRFRTMLRIAYTLASRVVAVSHGQARWIAGAGLAHWSKLHIVPSTTDIASLLDIPPPDRGHRPLRLGAYGRYCEQKGFETLVEAMHRIAPDIATLHIHGLGDGRAALAAAAGRLPHVTVDGPVRDLRAFLSSVDVVVVPSLWESFGQVALEARAAARPVIASDIDGLSEQVTSATGRLVAAGDAAALAATISDLSKADLAFMGLAARKSATQHPDATFAAWRRVFVACRPTAEIPAQSLANQPSGN